MDTDFSHGAVAAILGWLISTQFMVLLTAVIMLGAGLSALRGIPRDGPLAPYGLQILGMLFLAPVILLLALTKTVESNAVASLLGTIVGYVFGTARSAQERRSVRREVGGEFPRGGRDDREVEREVEPGGGPASPASVAVRR